MTELIPVNPILPLTRDEVADMESKAHALGLPSLVALAEGIDDEDVPFPYETGNADELPSLDELAYAELNSEEESYE